MVPALNPAPQGVSWIKEREARRPGGLVCVRMDAPDMLRAMERAVIEVLAGTTVELGSSQRWEPQ